MENTKDMFTEFYLECVGAEIAEVFVGNQEIERIDNLQALNLKGCSNYSFISINFFNFNN